MWAIFVREHIGIDKIPPIDLWIVPDLKGIEILSTLPVLLLLSDHAVDDSPLLIQIEDRPPSPCNTDNLLISNLVNLHFLDFASIEPVLLLPNVRQSLFMPLRFFFSDRDLRVALPDDFAG